MLVADITTLDLIWFPIKLFLKRVLDANEPNCAFPFALVDLIMAGAALANDLAFKNSWALEDIEFRRGNLLLDN